MSAPVQVGLRDGDLYQCLNDATGISEASKKTYLASLNAVLTKTGAAARYIDGQVLVSFILAADSSIQLIRDQSVSGWTRQAYVKAILSVYKHASCAAHPQLQQVRATWSAFCEELSAELDAVAKLNKKSAREETAWAPMHEWKQKEQELAATAFGSASHLLVACHTLWPPLRGGDLGQLFITSAADPRNSDGVTNVLVWTGTAKPEARIQHHKTSHLKGSLVRPVPPSLQRVINASLEQKPRGALFVSPANGQPFNSEVRLHKSDAPLAESHSVIEELIIRALRNVQRWHLMVYEHTIGDAVARAISVGRQLSDSTICLRRSHAAWHGCSRRTAKWSLFRNTLGKS